MKPVLIAMAQVILASGILYAYYHLFLRNKRFHQYNRFYLLLATIVSLLVPFLNIPVYFTPEEKESSFVLQTLSVLASPGIGDNSPVSLAKQTPGYSLTGVDLIYFIYLLVATLILMRMILSLLKIRQLTRNNPVERLENIYFINTDEPGTPFSFFRWLFWHKEIELHSEKGEQIFRHELFHIRQKHSLDILFMELVTIVCWINPFFHLIKKETKAIHEFLADQFAARKNQEWDYAELLLMQVFNTRHQLVNPFFQNQIKRRIAMITSSQQPRYQYFRKVLALPLLALVAGLFAFTYKQKNPELPAVNLPLAQIELRELSPADTPKNKTRPGEVTIKGTKIVLDNIQKNKTNEPKLIIINGKEYTSEEVKKEFGDKVVFEAGEVQVTAAGDPGAIKKYGARAKDGVINFVGAKISTGTLLETKQKPGFFLINDKPEPLIVLDEVVQVKGEIKEVLKDLSPSDIKEITVLKDKSATEKYGDKGVNGVIEVVTKNKPYKKLEEIKEVEGVRKLELVATPLSEVVVEDNPAGIDQQPVFKDGGDEGWRKSLERNLNSSIPSSNGAPVGVYKVIIQFMIDQDGTVNDIKALSNNGYGMEQEAIRVIGIAGKWNPGMVKGKPVRVYKKQAVIFMSGKPEELKEIVVTGFKSPAKITGTNNENLSTVYPNPTTNTVNLFYNTSVAGEGEIRVYDISSNLQMKVKTNLLKGQNNLSVNMSGLAKGIYMVEITDAAKKPARTYKVVKE